MRYTNFINKIATFYPTNRAKDDDKNVFYFDYSSLPSKSVVDFNIVIGALEIDKNYILHLSIDCNDGSRKIDTDIPIKGSKVSKDNLIESLGISTGSYTIHPASFNVDSGVCLYTASLTLKDDNENIYDTATTWFLTRLDPSYAKVNQDQQLPEPDRQN